MNDDELPLIVYFLLASLLILPLLGPGYYLALDMQRGPNSYSDSRFNDFYGVNPYGAYLPLTVAFSALSKIIPVEILQKILLFLILFLCGASAHYSLPKELGNSRYFAGFLYTLNPFVFIRFLAGHWSFLLSYALWPISIKFFIDFLQNPKQDNLVKAALITFAASISSHGVILLLLCYSVLFIFHMAKNKARPALIKQTSILAFLVLAMNLFWIAPVVLTFEETYAPASAEAYLEDFGAESRDLPLSLAIITMHGFWRSGFTYTKDVFDLWYILFLLIFAICAYGFFMLLGQNRMLAFTLLSIFALALLFSIGAESPVYFLFEMLPIHFIFRDSQKFVGLIALAYSMLGAYGVHFVLQKTDGRKRTLLLIALIAVPVAYNYGFFGFLDQIGPTVYPQEWVEADKIIAADNTSTNILVLPLHLYSRYSWVNSKQKTLANPAGPFFSKPVIAATNVETKHVYSDVNDSREQYLRSIFKNQSNNTAEMLLPLDVRYIILFRDRWDTAHYFNVLNNASNLALIFEGPTMYLFRNDLATGPSANSNFLEDPMFQITLALFLLSWLIVLALILDASFGQMALLAGSFAGIFLLASAGILTPPYLGALILLSVVMARAYR